MPLPSKEDIVDRRITQFKDLITKTIESEELGSFESIIAGYQHSNEADLGEVAAALAFLVQRERPLSPNLPAIPEQNARRDEHRGDRPTRSMTELEAARYVRMSQSYLRQSRMDGDRENRTPGPRFLKIGRSVRYLVDDLDAWLEQFRRDNV